MTTPLLFLFLMLIRPQQSGDSQLQRQQQQLQQMQQQVQQQQRDLARLLDEVQRQQQDRREEPRPVCTVDLWLINNLNQRIVPSAEGVVVPINLFSVVSNPSNGCQPAAMHVTASYLDGTDSLICNGTVENVATQHRGTQAVNLEIRPRNLDAFVRWKNEPPQSNSGPKRLVCLDVDGLIEAPPEAIEHAASVRIRAIVLPREGGLSTAEMRLNLR